MKLQFFWSRTASIWIALLYIILGLPLLLFPGASGSVFVWALAAGAAVYAVSHLWRYIQGRKMERTSGGDLFLAVLPLAFAIFSISWPQAILSFLPPGPGCAAAGRRCGKSSAGHCRHSVQAPHPDPPGPLLPDPHCSGSSAGGQSLPCGSAGHYDLRRRPGGGWSQRSGHRPHFPQDSPRHRHSVTTDTLKTGRTKASCFLFFPHFDWVVWTTE